MARWIGESSAFLESWIESGSTKNRSRSKPQRRCFECNGRFHSKPIISGSPLAPTKEQKEASNNRKRDYPVCGGICEPIPGERGGLRSLPCGHHEKKYAKA